MISRVRLQRLLWTAIACVLVAPRSATATSDADATAHAHGLVQQRAERGLVINKKSLAIGLDATMSSGAIDGYMLALPVRVGVHDEAEVFVSLQLQSIEPQFQVSALGITYRFRDGLLEMAAQASCQFAWLGAANQFAADVAMPMRFHFRENLSLDAAPTLAVVIKPAADWYLKLPLAGNFNLTDAFAVTGGTELSLQEGNAGASGMIVGGSWTAAKNGQPWLEIGARASWGNQNNVGLMQMVVFARYYHHLAGRRSPAPNLAPDLVPL